MAARANVSERNAGSELGCRVQDWRSVWPKHKFTLGSDAVIPEARCVDRPRPRGEQIAKPAEREKPAPTVFPFEEGGMRRIVAATGVARRSRKGTP